jgi:flagellar M-ring protein FliF
MNFFSLLVRQLTSLFSSQSAARRFFVFVVLTGSIGALGYLTVKARTGAFRTLPVNLPPAEAGAAAAALRNLDIPIRFTDDGSTFQVGSRRWDQALMVLASEGFLNGAPGQAPSTIGQPKSVIDDMLHGMSEARLARTIVTIAAIERAFVHLAAPPETIFIPADNAPRATASVMLKLRPGAQLSSKNVAGIAALVAHAVPNLDPDDVTIVDQNSQLLTHEASDRGGAVAMGHLEYKRDYERDLKERLENLLAKRVGEGRAVAFVAADFDFTQTTLTSEIFDPNSKTPIREKTLSQGGAPPAGATPAPAAISGAAAARGRDDREVEYAVSRTTTQTVDAAPRLLRLSVSIMVDSEKVTDAELPDLEALAQNVVGLSAEREGALGADRITVRRAPLPAADIVADGGATAEEPLLDPHSLREIVRWAVVAVIGVLLILLVLRPAVKSISIGASPVREPAGLPSPGDAEPPEGADRAKLQLDRAVEEEIQRKPVTRKDVTDATRSNIPKAAGIVHQWLDE